MGARSHLKGPGTGESMLASHASSPLLCSPCLAPPSLTQFPGATTGGSAFVQLEHDFQGLDHSINLKAMNPSPTDLTGIYQFNFLQSLTRNFALGLDGTLMRQSVDMPEANMGYVAKWTSDARDAVGTLQVQPQGVAQATYWQRVAERVEAAVDLQAIAAGGRREAAATVGAKWDFRMSTFRASIDTHPCVLDASSAASWHRGTIFDLQTVYSEVEIGPISLLPDAISPPQSSWNMSLILLGLLGRS